MRGKREKGEKGKRNKKNCFPLSPFNLFPQGVDRELVSEVKG
jgi:hypothetical protein